MSEAYDEVARADTGNGDYAYLEGATVSAGDQQVLGNLRDMADHLKALGDKLLEAEAVYKQAQQEYDNYRFQTLPTAMLSAGVQSVETSDGLRIEVKNKFYCNPNKNDADRIKIGQWLAAHGAAHLIKKQAVVDGAQIDALKEAAVPFVEKWDMNTNSLKAWIKAQLGLDGKGVAQFSLGDVPECVHFVQVDEVELSA